MNQQNFLPLSYLMKLSICIQILLDVHLLRRENTLPSFTHEEHLPMRGNFSRDELQ